jgi:predicted acetyltransferase
MALTLRWVGEDELDRVAETRMYCYGSAKGELERFKERLRGDERARPGDFLLAERNGAAVGTTTSLSMTMWVRGSALPCQGVAWVGTIKTHRRSGAGGQKGIASQLMSETLRKARERQQVVSALMPFRASYYEHFGYGLVETRHRWTIPLSILPAGNFDGIGFVRAPSDLTDLMASRQRMVEAGQCDIERSAEAWAAYRRSSDQGFELVDRGADGIVRGYMYIVDTQVDGRRYVEVDDQIWDSPDALASQLHFLASLRDQYSGAILTLPRDVPLNRMVREAQVPHRPVEHPVTQLQSITRMQVRILDHKRFLEALKLPANVSGKLTVAVHECEQTVSKFRLEVADGRAHVAPTAASADIELPDKLWAAVACGEISASQAARCGLVHCAKPDCLRLLDVLAIGPGPFCAEYF